MRGAILGHLHKGNSFLKANIITSVMFIMLHIPGCYFMGNLIENITQPIGGALSIFLISLLFGYAVKRSDSVMGGILEHFLNNFV
jgi:membrane protease YdiL (CAAX protease family)